MSTAAAVASRPVFVGVDVGTGSARVGKLLGSSKSPIQIWKEGDRVEQSSTDIWHAICAAVKAACSVANVAGGDVAGLGFAATCSLVAVDVEGSPVTVSLSGDSKRNIIVWMDHRAVNQAERISLCNSPVLQYCGGSLNPEMQPPKLLWVKENLQESWSMAFRWMDLSDWLSYRATGDDTRSLCTTVKWTYLCHAHMKQVSETGSRVMEATGWDDDFWEDIGLGDLVDGHHAKIAFPGHALGSGLTQAAAKELGLVAGTPVGTSLTDSQAGGVGVIESIPILYSETKDLDPESISHHMVLVCGTSTCDMVVSKNKLVIPGVWGPHWSAMVPEYWLTAGGQSASGGLLDYIIQNHVAFPHLANVAASREISIYELMSEILESMMHELNSPFLAALTESTHVLPDFHGNGSPKADPKVKGMISGLTLDTSEKHLALIYLATVQGLAYGTRQIVKHCNSNGHKIDLLLACGGLSKNMVFIQQHADITGYHIILPKEGESVLLGAAILGAVSSKKYATLREAMQTMNAAGRFPSLPSPHCTAIHDSVAQVRVSLRGYDTINAQPTIGHIRGFKPNRITNPKYRQFLSRGNLAFTTF